ncbi:MAG: serine hydrolase domain-containing protein [Verrucomicrobiota bacterium]|jgi:CubicO group peptidase (beta-lactamase class C family)
MDWQWTREAVSRGVEAGWHRTFHLAVIRHGIAWQISLGEAAPDAHGTEATCCPWLSAGKPLLALLAGRAVQAGFVDWDDPVAKWLPEFGGGGKHEVTIRHVLTHTGGFRLADQLDPAWDWDTALAWACAAPIEPGWVPGETAGYQARGSWLVLGEVLRRAWGGELEDLLQREVTGPLGLGSLGFSWNPAWATRHGMGWARLRRTTRTAGDPGDEVVEPTRIDPGSGLRGTARDMARLYAALLDPPDGWLARERWKEMVRRQRSGVTDRTFGAVVDFGLGFVLNTPSVQGRPMPYGYGPHASLEAFGHSGSQCACAFADPVHGLSVAWWFDGMPGEPVHQARQRDVNAAVYRDLGRNDAIGSGALA